jgi:Flp pilus assembly protein CpaB
MDRRIRLLVGLALIGTAAWLFLQQQQRGRDSAARTPPSPATPAAAATPRPPGPREFFFAKMSLVPGAVSRITTAHAELRTIPQGLPHPDESLLVKSLDLVKDLELDAPIAEGELLLLTRFSRGAAGAAGVPSLGSTLSGNWRAVSITVSAVQASAGFINQGDMVDVVATYTQGGRQMTRIVLENVEVLARGNEYITRQQPNQQRVVRGEDGQITFTLKVTPQMAFKLVYLGNYASTNQIRLLLRNGDDRAEVRSRGTLLREVVTDLDRADLEPEDEPADREIEILRGAVASTVLPDQQAPAPAAAVPRRDAGTTRRRRPRPGDEILEKIESPAVLRVVSGPSR